MALILRDGDYTADEDGVFREVHGAEELLERVLWKLSVRRGSFPLMPRLGSRLHLLGSVHPGQRKMMAKKYVTEALEDEPVQVTEVLLEQHEQLMLSVCLLWQGQSLTASMELGGIV